MNAAGTSPYHIKIERRAYEQLNNCRRYALTTEPPTEKEHSIPLQDDHKKDLPKPANKGTSLSPYQTFRTTQLNQPTSCGHSLESNN